MALPFLKDGRLQALAVSGSQRAAALPDVPTTVEAGFPNSEYNFWVGMFAPSKTPSSILDKLYAEMRKALQSPAVREALAKPGADPMILTARRFAKLVQSEVAMNAADRNGGRASKPIERRYPPDESMIRFLMIFLAGALLAPTAAQSNPDYPNKPVRIIVNVAPGGGVDTATRIIADKLRARLGQPFVVENRPGAGGNIGAEVVFQSEGDGYTLLASSPSPLAINGWLYKKLNFDPAGFEPVAMMSRIPNVLVVRPDFPAKSVQEVVAVAKANPGKFNFGSQGIGTASHLTGELFMTLTGTKLVHVPYKGNTSKC